MDAIDERNARALAGLRRGHVGEDHELLDQPVRFQPLRHDHAIDRAVRLEHDLAFGNLEVERPALVAGAAHRPVGGIKRRDDRRDDRLGDLVRPAGNGELRLFVMEPRGGADEHAMEGVRAFAAVGADHHAHRERRPVLPRAQRTQVVGDALRQHRHDAVGKVDRVAALGRGAVERRAGPNVVRHVGDGDTDDVAARIARVRVGLGVNGVVMVLGVGRIDGDERDFPPILAQLSCPPRVAGRAASASASAAREKTWGMPWA